MVSSVIWRNRLEQIIRRSLGEQIILFDVEVRDADVYDGDRELECANYARAGLRQSPSGKDAQVLGSYCDVGYAHELSRAVGPQVQNE